jgi:pilus assembly protein FimV
MFRKLILASAVSLALVPASATALGLGAIRTHSALYEPFVGEIALRDVKPDELDNIKVGLAPDAELKKVGASYSSALGELKFKPQISPQGRPIIRVTSDKPIREPYLDFLVEVRSAQGRMVKEYTVLLDPPSTVKRHRPRIAEAVAEPVSPTTAERAAAPVPKEALAGTAASPRSEAGFPLRYGPVQRGKGLWQAALAISPPGATLAQTAMAIYRSNQSAFIRGDINRLKIGAVLEVPSSAELFALNPARAEREFSMALQGRRVTAHPLAKEAVAKHPSSDHLTIAQAPAAGAAGSVSESVPRAGNNPSNPSVSKLGSLKNELLLVRESSESNRQETDDLRGRIRDLEGQLADIRKLLKLRNQQLAELQGSQQEEPELKVAEETGVLPATVADKQPPEPNPIPESEAKATAGIDEAVKTDSKTTHPVQVAPIDASKTMHTPAAAPALGAASEPKKPEASPEPELAVPPHKPMEPPAVATKPQTTTTTEASNKAEPVPSGPKLAQVSPPAVTAKVTGPIRKPADLQQAVAHRESEIAQFWETLPMPALAVAIGVPLLLLPIGWWLVHRRRLVQEAIDTSQFTTAAIPRAPSSSAHEVSEPSYEGDNDDVTTAAESSFGELSGLEGESGETDVASEADVYIAYGRYREAEYLLEEELSRAPERMDLRFKLAEAYFGAKNLAGLTKVKDEIAEAGGERLHEDQWQRVASMVRDLQGDKPVQPPEQVPGEPRDALPPTRETAKGPEGVLPPVAEAQMDKPSAAPDSRSARTATDSLDLSLDSERPAGADQAAARDTHAPGSGLDLDLDELSAFDLDLDAVERENRMAMQRGGDLAPPRSEEGPLDLPSGEWPQVSAGAEPASLDGSTKTKDSSATELASSQWQTDSTLWDEVSTKIDLARAYVDMADAEAARAILEEVTEEGSEAQRAEAKEILARLA